MALVIGRSVFTRMGGMNCWLGKKIPPLNVSKMAAATPIQVAGLKATYGEKYPYAKPWPNWETRSYTMIHEWFDNTSVRLNENSKVIIVDGNIGVGKNEFARRLAAGFDLKCIESVPDTNCFIEDGFDVRSLNSLLPPSAQYYDLEKFLTDPHPERGMVGRLQARWFFEKFMAYAHGLHHLLSTGQGFVMVRSPWTDDVFIDTFRRMGYITPKFSSYYYDVRDNSICDLLKPHISIYLDASVSTIKERIKKRAHAAEVDSKVLSDKFLTTLDSIYKEKVLTRMRKSGHVIEIDWNELADDLEMEVIVEEIQRLDLEPEANSHMRFQDWFNHSEDMYCYLRRYFGSKKRMMGLFSAPYPWDCPEVNYSEEDIEVIKAVVKDHPVLVDRRGESARLGQRNLFGIF